MNKLLESQLREHFGEKDQVTGNFARLLNVISGSYDHYEKDLKMTEQSIELSSKEMAELLRQLEKDGKDELKNAHNQLKTLLENIEEILYTVDMVSLKIVQISAACEKVYGYTPVEFMTDRDLWIKVVLPEDIHIVDKHIRALYEGKRVTVQYRIIHKDKSIRWLESKIIPRLDAAGQLIRMEGVTIDISERKRAEKELEESVSLLEATIESTADGILVADYNGKIVRFNKKFVELARIPGDIMDLKDDEKVLGFVLGQLTNPEEFLSKVKELYIQQTAVSFDIINFKDGRVFERYSQPQLMNGKYVGRVWSFRDISERKHAKEDLEKSFSLLEATLESTADGILVVDADARVVRLNSKFIELWRVPPEILNTGDDKTGIAFVSEQLINPEEFISKIKELNTTHKEVSFDTLQFKDGRTFERYSQPQLIKGKYAGRVWSFRDITDRKKAEDKIKESELRYRSLIEQATDAICIADSSMKLYDMNPSACTLLGYSKEEALQLSVPDLFLAEDLRAHPFKVLKLKSGETVSNERRFKRKDGTLVEVEINAQMLIDGRFIVFGRDISERKQAEKLMKESEFRYRSLIEQATDAICIADKNMRFIDVNSYACKLLGYSKEEALQLSVPQVLFIEDLVSNPFKYDNVQANEIIRNERRLKRKDGTPVTMEISTRLTEDGRFIMFGHDISERKKSEEALKESEKRLRQIIDLVPHFIFAKDANGKFILANEAVASAYGSSIEDLIGKTDADFNPQKEEVEHFMQEDLKVINSGNVKYNIEETITDAAGNILTLSTTKIPYTTPGVNAIGVLGVSVDITDRKKAEEQIKLSNERYELVIKTTNDMIWDWDLVHNTIFRNENYSKVFGAEAADRNQIGKWVKNVHAEDRETVEEYIRQKVEDPDTESWEVEFRYHRHNNEMAYLYDRGYIIRDENKKAIRMVGATSDITERKKAEHRLIQSEKYNRNLFDQSPVGLALARMDGMLEDVNEAYAKITGRTTEECKMLTYYEMTAEKYREQETEQLNSIELTGRYGPYEKEYIHKDGHLVPVRLSGTLLEKNGVKYIWSSVEDITEYKKAETQLRHSEESYRQIVETAQEGIWMIDENNYISFANKKMCEILGYSDGELKGKRLVDVMDEEGWEKALKQIQKRRESINGNYDVKYITKSGKPVWTNISTNAIFDEDGTYKGALAMVTDISERKQTEERNKFKAELLNTVGQSVIATDKNGTINFWNRAAEDIYGWTKEEALGKNIIDLTPVQQTKEQAVEIIYELSQGHSWSGEFLVQRKDSGTFPAFVTNSPIYDEHHNLSGFIGVSSDITERKKVEEALSNNELRFRTLTANAPVGIFQTDAEGKTTYVNETWLKYTGMKTEEALGNGWAVAVHPDDSETLINDWNNKFKKGLKSTSEYRLVEKNGNTRWVSGEAVPLFNNAGEITGYIGTLSDITDRKNAEVEIRRSEQRYRQIVETAQEGIWLIDENNCTTFVNKKMSEMFEYSQEEMMGKQNYYFKNDDEKKISAGRNEKMKKGISETHNSEFITKSGKTIWTTVSTNPVFDDTGVYKGTLAMVTDITQRKLDEESLQRSEADLEIKNKQLEQKNKELEQFAYIASHDMQEPLRTTSSFVELLQKQYQGKLDEKADKYLNFIAQSSDRMKVLIKDLLDYSRIGRKKELAEVDCNTMLDEVLADLGTAINETGAEIKTEQLPVIIGYPTEIKQLFQNLIMNAIKFRKKNISPQIKISSENIPGFWLFAFKDNGIGIEEKHNERIFEIFQRLHTRTEYEGSGIGLAHSKKIVELHSGRIWIESEFGQGATFYFTIRKKNNDEKEIKLHITH